MPELPTIVIRGGEKSCFVDSHPLILLLRAQVSDKLNLKVGEYSAVAGLVVHKIRAWKGVHEAICDLKPSLDALSH